ncbi:hypothetical protein Q5752_001459 [Cryptotrichosporon argae]
MSVPSIQVTDVKPDIKPFADGALFPPADEEELQIAPTLEQSKVWALKIPRFLLERWERVNEGGVHLATLVVDNSTHPPRISLKLPDTADAGPSTPSACASGSGSGAGRPSQPISRRPLAGAYDTHGIPDEYEVTMPAERVRNTYVFTERERTWVGGRGESGLAKRKREKAEPTLLAALDHEGSVRPTKSAKYLKILEQRRLDAEQSKRPIVHLDDTNTSRGLQAQLASGFHNAASTFGSGLLAPRAIPFGERYARMDRSALLDRLFTLFADKPYWSITALRATVKQPDVYLRDVLADIAVMIKEGAYANMWELKDSWKATSAAGARAAKDEPESKHAASDTGLEDDELVGKNDDDGDDDDEFEDDDFEEVGM